VIRVGFLFGCFYFFACNGGICAVCGCVGLAGWALPQIGVDALLQASYFLIILYVLFISFD
jgi:hypothetical protein